LKENIFTSFASLTSATPSANAEKIWLDEFKYDEQNSTSVTIWMSGFIVIARTSPYLFSVNSNGVAVLYVSTDSTEANKVVFILFL
jgi:hypothetical protein